MDIGGAINEAATGSDQFESAADFVANIQESVVAIETVIAQLIFQASILEAAQGQDSAAAAFLWNLINDFEATNWQNINTAETSGWQNVNTAQSNNWQSIPTI